MQRPATRLHVLALVIAIAAAWGVVPLLAQRGQSSVLHGVVRDAAGRPLAGVALTVSGPGLIGGSQRAVTDGAGRYRIPALPSGHYTLAAALSGFESLRRSGIELLPGLSLTLDLVLNVSPAQAEVEVVAVAPAVDVRSSASLTTIGRAALEQLPLESRQPSNHVNLAPGIAGGVAMGGAAFATAVAVDGTNGTSPIQGAPEAAPAVYWLDSLQIIAIGANAEYGDYTTARLNAVTRSGTNRFSGLSEHVWTRPTWARWSELREWGDTYAQLGGPILRDRLWFFGGLERHGTAARVAAFANQPLTPGEPLSEFAEQKALFKLTSAPSARSRLDGYAFGVEAEALNGNANPFVMPEALGAFASGQRMGNLRFTWMTSGRTMVEAHAGWFSAYNRQGPADPSRRSGPPPHRDQATGVFSVNFPQNVLSVRRVRSTQVSVTRYLSLAGGSSHELKAGVEHEQADVEEDFGWPGGMFFLDRNGQPELVRFWDGARYRPSHDRTSLFVQDNWQIGRLTLEPGLRISLFGSSVPVAASATYANHAISPRVGAAWDVNRDHRTVVRAHYGHYNDPMATRLFEYLSVGAESPIILARVVGPGQYEEISRSGGPTNIPSIDPGIRHSSVEEWSAGIEHELRPRLSIKAQYVRRHTRNAMGFIDHGSTWTPLGVIDPGPDGRLGTDDDGDAMTVFINTQATPARFVLTNPDGAWRHYDGVQFVASRRFAGRWSLQASYAWGRTVGSFDNEHGSNAGTTDMATNGHFANPNRAINATGRTVFDRRHDVRVFGAYGLPYWGGVRLSGVFGYTSGAPWGRLVNSFDPRTLATVLVEPVGTRTVPAAINLDLRIEKTLPFRSGVVAGLFADVFNATNRVVPSRYQQVSGSAFGSVTGWTTPRRFRLGLRVTF